MSEIDTIPDVLLDPAQDQVDLVPVQDPEVGSGEVLVDDVDSIPDVLFDGSAAVPDTSAEDAAALQRFIDQLSPNERKNFEAVREMAIREGASMSDAQVLATMHQLKAYERRLKNAVPSRNVPASVVAKRRAKNKAAKASRKRNR